MPAALSDLLSGNQAAEAHNYLTTLLYLLWCGKMGDSRSELKHICGISVMPHTSLSASALSAYVRCLVVDVEV